MECVGGSVWAGAGRSLGACGQASVGAAEVGSRGSRTATARLGVGRAVAPRGAPPRHRDYAHTGGPQLLEVPPQHGGVAAAVGAVQRVVGGVQLVGGLEASACAQRGWWGWGRFIENPPQATQWLPSTQQVVPPPAPKYLLRAPPASLLPGGSCLPLPHLPTHPPCLPPPTYLGVLPIDGVCPVRQHLMVPVPPGAVDGGCAVPLGGRSGSRSSRVVDGAAAVAGLRGSTSRCDSSAAARDTHQR